MYIVRQTSFTVPIRVKEKKSNFPFEGVMQVLIPVDFLQRH